MTADSICLASDDMIAVAWNSDSCLYLVELTLDGVGITGAVKEFSRYPSDCKSVYAMFISNRTLVISYNEGIAKIEMATQEQAVLLSNGTPSCNEVRGIAPFGDMGETVFTDIGSRQIKKVSSNGTKSLQAQGRKATTMALGPLFPSLWVFAWRMGRIFLSLMHRLEL